MTYRPSGVSTFLTNASQFPSGDHADIQPPPSVDAAMTVTFVVTEPFPAIVNSTTRNSASAVPVTSLRVSNEMRPVNPEVVWVHDENDG